MLERLTQNRELSLYFVIPDVYSHKEKWLTQRNVLLDSRQAFGSNHLHFLDCNEAHSGHSP